MARSVLIVEDDPDQKRGFAKALTKARWRVCSAADVGGALSILRSKRRFDVVLLDLRLVKGGTVEDGSDLLRRAKSEGVQLPVVVVLSAILDAAKAEACLQLGVRALVSKPIRPSALPRLLDAFCGGMDSVPLSVGGADSGSATRARLLHRGEQQVLLYDSESSFDLPADAQVTGNAELLLSREIKQRENALSSFIKERSRQPFPGGRVKVVERRQRHRTSAAGQQSGVRALQPSTKEPLLVVGRRWNSWYPSFFDVDGGAYVVLGATARDRRIRGALIDPGFKAVRVLSRLGISVASLDTCIITHNHPDHVGGFFEYAAARHAAEQGTVAYCSQSVASMLGTYAGSLHVGPFDRTGVEILPACEATDTTRAMRVLATPVVTSHHTVGHVEGTRGILLSVESPGVAGHFDCQSTALLLGDTEYQSERGHVNAAIFDGIRAAFSRVNLRVVVLHIGGCQYKDSPGKHLYLTGLVDILRDIEQYRQNNQLRPPAQKLLVLVSEWGLEHATRTQVLGALPRGMPLDVAEFFDGESRVKKTIEVIKDAHRFETMELLPADEGLTVGLVYGEVYLSGRPVRPEKVRYRPNARGLEYFV